MPSYAGPLVQNAPSAPANDVVTVPDLASRDLAANVASLRVGAIVRVVADGHYYQLLTSTPTWVDLGTALGGVGNHALFATLTNSYDIVGYFVDGNSGDDANDGSFGSPWATHQRFVDELPPGTSGIAVCHTIGGPQSQVAVDVSRLRGSGGDGITLIIVGDTSSPVETVTLSGASNGKPAGFVSTELMVASPFTTNVDENSHWLYQPFDYLGVDFPQSWTTVGTIAGGTTHESNTAGELAVMSTFALAGGDYEIQEFTTTITPLPADALATGNLVITNPRHSDGVRVQYFGVEFLGTSVTLQSVSAFQCRVSNRDLFTYGKSSFAIHKSGTGSIFAFAPVDTQISAIQESGSLRVSPSAYTFDKGGNQVLTLGPLINRGSDPTPVRISNNQYAEISIANASHCDFPGGTTAPFHVRNGRITFAAANAIGLGATHSSLLNVEGSHITFQGAGAVNGTTTGVCIVALADASVDGCSTALANLTSALGGASEIKLGANSAQAFSSGPAGDVTSLTRFS